MVPRQVERAEGIQKDDEERMNGIVGKRRGRNGLYIFDILQGRVSQGELKFPTHP